MRQEQTRQLPTPSRDVEDGALGVPVPTPTVRLPASADEGRVLVMSVRFSGAVSQPEEALQKLLASQLNRELSFNEIQSMANTVAEFYRKQGYFLAQVLVPVQDISGGNLTLQVIEGKLSERASRVAVQGQERSAEKRISGTLLAPLEPGMGLNESELERAILVLNDLPGIKTTVMVEPGEEAETSRLVATVREGNMLRGSASLDNAGNRYTGALRAGLSVYADNLTGQGDQASLQTSRSVHGDFSYARMAYTRPFGYDGLVGGVALSGVDYTSGKELASLDAQGEAESVMLNAQYPLIRSRPLNLYVISSLENRVVRSETLGVKVTDKRFDVFSLGLSGDSSDSWMGGGINSAFASISQGRLDLDRLPGALQADQASTGQKTNGDYVKLNFTFTRLQSLTQATVGQVSLSGQYARQNLDSGEKFALGGPIGVKAYPGGEGLGDRGVVLSTEVRTVLAKAFQVAGHSVGDVQFSAFHDIGRVTQFDEAPSTLTTPRQYLLRDAGVGFNIGNAGVYDLRIYLARALGNNPGADSNGKDSNGRSSKTRLILFTTIYF